MAYRFLAPRLDDPARPLPPCLSLLPEVRAFPVLDAPACLALANAIIAAHDAGQSWASRTRYADPAQWDENQQFRRSKNISPQLDGLQPGYEAMHAAACKYRPSFGLDALEGQLETVDEQCLVYHEGDRIGDHADDSALAPADDGGEPAWHVVKPERHLVGVMWLTTQTPEGLGHHEFSGGTFRFNSLVDEASGAPLDIHPSAGHMIVFPANPWFRHEVLPVLAGTRIAITRWWRIVPVIDVVRASAR